MIQNNQLRLTFEIATAKGPDHMILKLVIASSYVTCKLKLNNVFLLGLSLYKILYYGTFYKKS